MKQESHVVITVASSVTQSEIVKKQRRLYLASGKSPHLAVGGIKSRRSMSIVQQHNIVVVITAIILP